MTSPRDDLEDLFADAMQAQAKTERHSHLVMKNARPEAPKKLRFSEMYVLPENWQATRVIALIHRESQTLLGNYQEFHHKKNSSASKLLRVTEPCVISGKVWVEGPQWIMNTAQEIPAPHREEHFRELVLADLFLHEMGVHAEVVSVKVVLAWGGIARCELLDHTQFISPDARSVLTLPAGVNVLEAMDLEAKIKLRKELAV